MPQPSHDRGILREFLHSAAGDLADELKMVGAVVLIVGASVGVG